MAKQHDSSKLTLEARDGTGTTSAKALRRAGKIPGVVYGHGGATPISVDAKQLTDLLHSPNRRHIVEATVAGTKDSVLVRHVDADPITRRALSVDFQRVAQGEAIVASVNVVTAGVPVGVRDQGGVMDVVTHALDVKGPAQSIPDQLTVDVAALTVHTHVTAGEVALPSGFTLITPPDTIVVSVSLTRASAGEGVVEATPAEAPEVA